MKIEIPATIEGNEGNVRELKLARNLVNDLILEERKSISDFLDSDKKSLDPDMKVLLEYPADFQEMFRKVIQKKVEIINMYETKLADIESKLHS